MSPFSLFFSGKKHCTSVYQPFLDLMSSSTSSPHRQDALLRLTRPDFDTLVHRFLQRHRALSLPTEKWIWRKEEGLLELQGHLQPLPPSNSRETEEEEEDGWIPEVEPEEDDPSEWTNPPPIQSQDQQQDPLFPRAWSSWTYLIHWSPIWQVPVLYISAQHLGRCIAAKMPYPIPPSPLSSSPSSSFSFSTSHPLRWSTVISRDHLRHHAYLCHSL